MRSKLYFLPANRVNIACAAQSNVCMKWGNRCAMLKSLSSELQESLGECRDWIFPPQTTGYTTHTWHNCVCEVFHTFSGKIGFDVHVSLRDWELRVRENFSTTKNKIKWNVDTSRNWHLYDEPGRESLSFSSNMWHSTGKACNSSSSSSQ